MNKQRASIPAYGKAPGFELSISRDLQHCVTLGTVSADAWRDIAHKCLLNDYLGEMAAVFSDTVSAGMAEVGKVDDEAHRSSQEAFIAGFLGRVQQWLGAYPLQPPDRPTKH